MMKLVTHLCENAEVYTVLFMLFVVPLSYFTIFSFCQKHFGMFEIKSAGTRNGDSKN